MKLNITVMKIFNKFNPIFNNSHLILSDIPYLKWVLKYFEVPPYYERFQRSTWSPSAGTRPLSFPRTIGRLWAAAAHWALACWAQEGKSCKCQSKTTNWSLNSSASDSVLSGAQLKLIGKINRIMQHIKKEKEIWRHKKIVKRIRHFW